MTAWIVVLYLAGLCLFLAEFIIPGMISGILGGTMIVASIVMVVQNFPHLALIVVMLQLLGVLAAVLAGMYALPRTRLSRHLILSDSQEASAGWVSADTDQSLVGAEGVVYTALRPAGTIMVNDTRYDAVADGSFIDKGRRIRVIAVHGSRIVVEEAETEAQNGTGV